MAMDYAIIRLGGKQYRVREGETLVVDRVKAEQGKSFAPDVLLGESGVKVTATVLAHERGPKIIVGKYRRRTGYKRHTGFRAATSRVEISLGGPEEGGGGAQEDRSGGARRDGQLPPLQPPERPRITSRACPRATRR